LSAFDFESQPHVVLRLYVAQPVNGAAQRVVMHVLDEKTWTNWLVTMPSQFSDVLKGEGPPAPASPSIAKSIDSLVKDGTTHAWLAPRAIGLTAWKADPNKQVQIKRRLELIGQTLDGMRVWDVRRGLQALRSLNGMSG